MIYLDLSKYDNGTNRLHVSTDEEHGFYMNFTFDELKETNPEVFLIKMAGMIESLFEQRGKEFTWELKT